MMLIRYVWIMNYCFIFISYLTESTIYLGFYFWFSSVSLMWACTPSRTQSASVVIFRSTTSSSSVPTTQICGPSSLWRPVTLINISPHVKCFLFLPDFNQIWIWLTYFSNNSYIKLYENLLRDSVMNLMVAFHCWWVDAPKNLANFNNF